jgi:hypothetical protein
MENKVCIVSLGVNSQRTIGSPAEYNQNYSKGLKRLESSLVELGYNGDFMLWDKYPEGAPSHEESHCGYKPFTMYEALKKKYKIVIWIDASIYAIKDISPLLEIIEKRGYLFFKELHSLGEYCKDDALHSFNISREESFEMPSIKGGVVGLNLTHQTVIEFLEIWKEKAMDGSFVGAKWSGVKGWPRTVSTDARVKGHRSQTIASLIALQMDLKDWESIYLMNEYFVIDRNYVRLTHEKFPSLIEKIKARFKVKLF